MKAPRRRSLASNGYRFDVIAYFPCNSCGVRVGVRRTRHGAERFAVLFGRRNAVQTSLRLRFDPSEAPR